MNDSELITVLREQRDKVPMTTPVEHVISRGRAVRTRRRVSGVAAVAGAATAVAVGVALALPASHPPTRPGAQLAAWTVVRQGGGGVRVTINELRDPAGLQARLRADGVPVSVTFSGHPNPACSGYSGEGDQRQRRHRLGSVVTGPVSPRHAMIIHPGALPSGAGLQIFSSFRHYPGQRGGFAVAVSLVQASQRCTGS